MSKNMDWKNKPIAVLHNEINNGVFLERISRDFQIHYSSDLLPFSCHIPSSGATFLLIDFTRDFASWNSDQSLEEEKISWLTEFVKLNVGPNLVYLCPCIDQFLISVSYDIQRSVEIMVPNKNMAYGFATSWKTAANYIKKTANKLSCESMEQENVRYEKELEYIMKLNEETAAKNDLKVQFKSI